MGARPAECAGPGRGGSKDPGEFGRISKKVCMRANLGRRQGAADSIESAPGGSTAALLVCGRRSAVCFYFWAGSRQVLGKFLALQEGDTNQTSKCVPGGSKMAVQTGATLSRPDRQTRKEHLNTGQKARKNRSQIAQTIAKILLFRSPEWAKACDGGQNVPRSHFRSPK